MVRVVVLVAWTCGVFSRGVVFLLSNSEFLSKSKMIAPAPTATIKIRGGIRHLEGSDRLVFFMEIGVGTAFFCRDGLCAGSERGATMKSVSIFTPRVK